MGRPEEARRSLAWALQVSPASLPLPKLDEAATRQTAWSDLFRYARSRLVSWLSNLGMQTTGLWGDSVILWAPTLFVMLLGVSPALSVHICEFGGVRRALCLLRAFRADRLRIEPRETSGTEGSNLSSSSGESGANSTPRLRQPAFCEPRARTAGSRIGARKTITLRNEAAGSRLTEPGSGTT
jgi:hypothetical protein